MPFGYIILLVAGPLLELALLIKVGQWLGLWPLFGIIIGTGVLGVLVLRLTGISVLRRILSGALTDDPLPQMMDTSVRFTAGVLLILPGLIGDCLGALLLIPAVRRMLIPLIWRGVSQPGRTGSRFQTRRWSTHRRGTDGATEPDRPTSAPPRQGGGPVIDGEFERLGERTLDPKRPPTAP